MTAFEPWNYREKTTLPGNADVVGFDVESVDGGIGKVDEATYDAGSSWVVVDTGPWIFGRRVLLPAGTITQVDIVGSKVYVDRSKDQIRNSPELGAAEEQDVAGYRDRLGEYYGDTYRGR